MLPEQTAQLPLAHAETLCKRINVSLIERAFSNQPQSARHRVRCPSPRAEVGRAFRTASQARPEAGLLRSTGRCKKGHVLALGRPCWTDRSAVNAGCVDTDKYA